MQNVIVCLFDVESEGYQAITELRNTPAMISPLSHRPC